MFVACVSVARWTTDGPARQAVHLQRYVQHHEASDYQSLDITHSLINITVENILLLASHVTDVEDFINITISVTSPLYQPPSQLLIML